MTELQIYLTFVVFAGVILAIAFNLIDLTLATLLGVSILTVTGVLTREDAVKTQETAGGTIALLFGGMVVARILATTGIFAWVGALFLRATKGSGKRFLLGLIVLVAPLCAFLPNATVVILLAPIIIQVARALDVDFVGPMVLTAIISNSAGLLTLVGDPATFLVGSAIGLTFLQYLQRVSLGGLLSVLVLIPLIPRVMGDVWRVQRSVPTTLQLKPLERPFFAVLALAVLVMMIVLFLVGEQLPLRVVPPAVAIVGASLALLVVYSAKVEPIEHVIKDIDWKTLIFLICMFVMVQAFTKTGILRSLSQNLYQSFGVNLLVVGLVMLAGIGAASSLLANIPVVAASILLVKGYFVMVELVPEEALGSLFSDWPASTLPVFVAMMFGATLGGNATLIGASANVVSAGICAANGKPLSFATFLRYGVPLTLCQLVVSALYVVGLFYMVSR
ncbi:MAG TPA: SLC13 family permease [Candidatus Binatia bacterium]|nr:SLC13 family permease [Candidatus Binatia bacterium]